MSCSQETFQQLILTSCFTIVLISFYTALFVFPNVQQNFSSFQFFQPLPSKKIFYLLFIHSTEITLRYSIFFCLCSQTFFWNGRKLLLWHKHAYTHTRYIHKKRAQQKFFSSCQRRKENLFNNVREMAKEEEKLRSEMKQFFVCCLQHRYLFLLLLNKPSALTI